MLVREVAEALSAQVVGDGAIAVERIVHPSAAEKPSDLAIAMTGEAFSALAGSRALAAVVSAKQTPPQDKVQDKLKAIIVAPQGRETLAALTALFDKGPARLSGIHPSAIVDPSATIGDNVSVGPLSVIGPRSRIGDNTVILSQVTIGADVTIGAGGLIYPGVRIGDRVSAGARLRIHANAVIGADGFSFGLSPDKGAQQKFSAGVTIKRIHSLGAVIIGDDVEIGACATIDRATLDNTRIGNGTKIDNLVQIAHNVTVGEDCLICGMVGLSGSVVVGDRVRIGGGVGVADHLRVGSESTIAAGSGVATNVGEGLVVSGYPAMRHDRSTEYFTYLGRQKALHKKVDDMQARIQALEEQTRPTRAK